MAEKRSTERTDGRVLSREQLWALLDAHKSEVSPEAIDWALSVLGSGEINLMTRGPFKTLKQWRAESGPTDPRNAARGAREDYGELSAPRIAQGIGTFADDPPDTRYQRAYLKELWTILREKMPRKGP